MSHVRYHIGGHDPEHPSENRAEEWDDETRTYTAWHKSGRCRRRRPYTKAEHEEAEQRANTPDPEPTLEERMVEFEARVTALERQLEDHYTLADGK